MRRPPKLLPSLALLACTATGELHADPMRPCGDAHGAAAEPSRACTSERRVSPRSEGPPTPSTDREPPEGVGVDPRLATPWPTVVAIVPGALVHGSGHFAMGHDDTALRLLALEGIGVGATLVSGTTLVLTGASRYLIAPAALLAVGGIGLFTLTFFADVYGTVAPPGGFGRPVDLAPLIETDVGYRYLYDPQFDHRNMGVARVDARWSALRVSPSAWVGLDAPTRQLRLEVGVSPVGPRPRRTARRGTRFEAKTAYTHRAFDDELFRIDTVELAAGGRLDLEVIGPSLEGSFAEAEAGGAVATTSYGEGVPPDTDLLLLARFAFGVYLGAGRGEARAFYDHRHDGYVAGAIIPGLGSGVAGQFGLDGFYYVTPHWGVGAEGLVGSAYAGGFSLRFRQQ